MPIGEVKVGAGRGPSLWSGGLRRTKGVEARDKLRVPPGKEGKYITARESTV